MSKAVDKSRRTNQTAVPWSVIVFLAMPFQQSEKVFLQTDYVGYTLVSNVLIYLLSHSFLYKFGDVAEVGYWSIILKSVSVKTSLFKQGCDMCSLERGWEKCSLL